LTPATSCGTGNECASWSPCRASDARELTLLRGRELLTRVLIRRVRFVCGLPRVALDAGPIGI
jgi:hypothetical protein